MTETTQWEVVVGNIGRVYEGTNGFEARKLFNIYVSQSQTGYGHAAGENVTLLRDRDIYREYVNEKDHHND